jgi:hypothetical protein
MLNHSRLGVDSDHVAQFAPIHGVAGELLFRPFFLRIPTQCNNVTMLRWAEKRLNRVFG